MNKLCAKALLILTIGIFTVSCTKDDEQCIAASQDPACICTRQYDPVCGCNGITYGNSCMAECSGITDFVPGKCNQ